MNDRLFLRLASLVLSVVATVAVFGGIDSLAGGLHADASQYAQHAQPAAAARA